MCIYLVPWFVLLAEPDRPDRPAPQCQSSLSHRRPDFLCILTGERHVILCGGAALEVEMQQPSSKVGFSDEVEIDGHVTCTFFIFHFDEPHNAYLIM